MFRIRIFKYITNTRFQYQLPLKNSVKSPVLNQCNCMSTIRYDSIGGKSTLTSNNQADITFRTKDNRSEREFLVRLKNDPDLFGSPDEKDIVDEGDIQEERYFTEQPSPRQKLSEKQYADIIKDLIKKRKIKEAIDVVEIRMLKEDRVKPGCYIYNLLLGACGRVGYTKKAFMLYNQLKRRGLTPTGGTYTALFNACSNSPWPTTDGLTRATHLRNIMIEKGYEPNDTNYNAMIKAFGRCGDIPMAFALVDEMSSKKIAIKDDTLNFLLQACVTDKEAGFRHALLVWRKVVNRRIKPSVYTYNLMLRTIRDCGLGDIEVTRDVIDRIVSGNTNFSVDKRKNRLLESSTELLTSASSVENKIETENEGHKLNTDYEAKEDISKDLTTINETHNDINKCAKDADNQEFNLPQVDSTKSKLVDVMPNLMSDVPHLGSIVHLSEITKPEERLLLVGGASGFLENMKQHECVPDIKTFTLLLDAIPGTLAAEKELLAAMKKLKIKPDVDFFNMLIKKRSMRFDYENAKEVLRYLDEHNFRPDLVTYGVLALGCKTKEEAVELIEAMKQGSYSLNAEILGAMLHQACYHKNSLYVLEVMETCLRENVQPNKVFMETLAKFKKSEFDRLHAKQLTKRQEKLFGIFRARYKNWLQEAVPDETEDAHPWQQYRETNAGGEKYKWKDNARFKPRRLSRFKLKTSPKYKKEQL